MTWLWLGKHFTWLLNCKRMCDVIKGRFIEQRMLRGDLRQNNSVCLIQRGEMMQSGSDWTELATQLYALLRHVHSVIFSVALQHHRLHPQRLPPLCWNIGWEWTPCACACVRACAPLLPSLRSVKAALHHQALKRSGSAARPGKRETHREPWRANSPSRRKWPSRGYLTSLDILKGIVSGLYKLLALVCEWVRGNIWVVGCDQRWNSDFSTSGVIFIPCYECTFEIKY